MAIWFSDGMFFHSEEERDYYAAVGMYITTWAGMETILADFIHLLRDRFDGKSIDTEMPRALKRRLSFLRQAAKSSTAFDNETRENLLKICGLISQEAKFRHDLTHGANVNFYKSSPHFTIMQRGEDASKPHSGGPAKRIDKLDVVLHHEKLNEITWNLGVAAILTYKKILQQSP